MPVTVRPLERSEWSALRDLRLHALRTEPGVFASSYAVEAAAAQDVWQSRMYGPDRQIFGAFDGDRLVGITGVIPFRDDAAGETAMLVMSYLCPEYRGRGLSALFYDARLRWVREQPQLKRVVVSHRRSNEASRRANQRYGFVLTKAVSTTWPDGAVEDELQYELPLARLDDTALVSVTDDDFAAMLRGADSVRDGLVPAPGGIDEPVVIAHVRSLAARLHRQGYSGGHWMVVAGGEVVGLIGFKHPPSPRGEVEIGYGIASSRRRRGHATRAVAALLEAARRDPAIRTVLAETAVGNTASQRALRSNGFERAGTRFDPADGELVVWRRSLR